MAKVESLGIKTIESVNWYVHDLERTRRFYVDQLDFQEVGVTSAELEQKSKQKAVVFKAGNVVINCIQPAGEGGRAARYLRKHPEGVGTLNFEVEDVQKTFRLLEARGGTAIDEVKTHTDGQGGKLSFFSITTPFGDTTFRFVQRDGYRALYPGLETHSTFVGGKNRFGFTHVDHTTSNFQTMAPALLWLEHVMGFEAFWKIQFHTEDVAKDNTHGSGLRSQVYWDPHSHVKFANNEPYRPFFKASQINIFNEDHRGDGVQHLALAVKDVVACVRGMREHSGIKFMPTPGSYYDALPERIQRLGIKNIDEDIALLRQLGVLVDGDKEHSYLLQIFMKEGAGQFNDPKAGPFFYELIQRKGDQGFGGGNFRALFESIERDQKAAGR